MGSHGQATTIAGTATTTETNVSFTSQYIKGAPNFNTNSRPSPRARPPFLKGDIVVQNLDPTNNLLVRLNGGAQKTILPKDKMELRNTIVKSLSVKASAATVAYDITANTSN